MAKEFSMQVIPNLGLRPREGFRGNMDYAVELRNLVPREEGLCPPPTFKKHNLPSQAWPYPQFHRGSGSELLVLGADYAATYDEFEGSSPLTVSGTIVPEGPWHLWSFGSAQFISTNGRTLLAHTEGTKVASQDIQVASLAHDDRQLLFLGGLSGPNTETALFEELFEHWRSYSPNLTSSGHRFGKDWVLWLRTADIDAPEECLLYILGLSQDDNLATVKTLIERRAIGFERVQNCGDILSIVPIASRFVVYGTRGIYAITPSQEGMQIGSVYSMGICSRGAVWGDFDHHYIVTADRVLRKYSQNGTFTRLGYNEYLRLLSSEDIVCCAHIDEGHYYIGDGANCYVYTEKGMWQSSLVPTAIVTVDEEPLAFLKGREEGFELLTVEGDFGFRGLKQSRFLEVSGQELEQLRMWITCRYDKNASPFESAVVAGSPEGIFFLNYAFLEMAIGLSGKFASSDGKVDRIHVRFQFADGRSVRGPRVTGVEQGAGEEGSAV